MIEKTLTLQEIQNIAGVIDQVKKHDGSKELDGKAIYWLGRLRDWCSPILEKIQETSNEFIIKRTIKKNPDGSRKINHEDYSNDIKKLMSEKETIKFPEFKASQFVKDEDSLVPTEFWQIMSEHIEIDVDWMKEEKVKDPKKKAS
jgi:hypothetical protein